MTRKCRDCHGPTTGPAARYCVPCGKARQGASWKSRLCDRGLPLHEVEERLKRGEFLETAPAWVRKEAGL